MNREGHEQATMFDYHTDTKDNLILIESRNCCLWLKKIIQ